MKSTHVLLVEDEKNTQLSLSLILRRAGFKVTTLDDGLQAFHTIVQSTDPSPPIDVLVIDIQLPGMTGLELLEALEKRKIELPTLIISGYRYREGMEEYKNRENFSYLEKPFSPDDFLLHLRLIQNTSDHQTSIVSQNELYGDKE